MYLISALALLGTWTFNIRFILEGKPATRFFTDSFANNAVASSSTDITIIGLILMWWMVRESVRYKIKYAWGYVLFSLCIAISVVFPLFLIARRRALLKHTEIRKPDALTKFYPIGSVAGLVLVNLFVIRFFQEGKSFAAFVTEHFANNAGGSLTVDLIFLTTSLFLFGITEARRGNVKYNGAHFLLCIFGVSFTAAWMLRQLDFSKRTPAR